MSMVHGGRLEVVQHGRTVATLPVDLSARAGVVRSLVMLSVEVNAALDLAKRLGAEHGYCDVVLRDPVGRQLDEDIMIV